MVKKAIVTLDEGPLGVAVACALQDQGWEVDAWLHPGDPAPPGLSALKRPHQQVDLSQPIALERSLQGVEALFHCRRLGTLGAKARDDVYRVNVEETAHLLSAARLAKVGRFVYRGSIFGIGSPKVASRPPPSDWDLLGLKLPLVQGDRLAYLEAERQGTLGLPLSIIIPPMLLGPGGTLGLSPILDRIQAGQLPIVARQALGVVDPRDLAQAMVKAVEEPTGTFIYPGTSTTWGELGQLIAGLSPSTSRPLALLPGLALGALGRLAPKSALGQGLQLLSRDWAYGSGGLFGLEPRPLNQSVANWAAQSA